MPPKQPPLARKTSLSRPNQVKQKTQLKTRMRYNNRAKVLNFFIPRPTPSAPGATTAVGPR